MDDEWRWDPTLYAGTARHYARGRVAYPAALVQALAREAHLTQRDTLLDLGCGPGSLTLPLAAHVGRVIGVDADPAMLAQARHLAGTRGITNATWLHRRAEELPAEVTGFRVVTLAQSFHWMDRARVAAMLHRRLPADGLVVFLHATTHRGMEGEYPLPYPRPPHRRIDALIALHLGPVLRAGRGRRQFGTDAAAAGDAPGTVERQVFTGAGFAGPQRLQVAGDMVERSTESILASVLSLSYAAPHLFGDRLAQFEQELRRLLHEVSPTGRFSEQMPPIDVDLWTTTDTGATGSTDQRDDAH